MMRWCALPLAITLVACGDDGSSAETDSSEPTSGRSDVDDGGALDAGTVASDPRYEQLIERAAEAPRDGEVEASAETEPMPFAEGATIWVHPTDRSQSTVIVSDQALGLAVFGLDGQRLQDVSLGVLGAAGVDVRDDVPLGDDRVSLVVAGNTGDDFIRAFAVDPQTGTLRSVISRDIPAETTAHGSCLYRSAATGELYLFVTSKDGLIVQHALRDDGSGEISTQKVREIQVEGGNPAVEACTADDELGWLYLAQEEEARILRYAAEPEAGSDAVLVEDVGDDAGLNTEGMAIYRVGESGGYLVVAMQGTWNYRVYSRDPSAHGGSNVYLGSFEVIDGPSVDGTMSADAMAITNAGLGGPFVDGLVLVQDRFNTPAVVGNDTNYKLVPWTPIADALGLLTDPR